MKMSFQARKDGVFLELLSEACLQVLISCCYYPHTFVRLSGRLYVGFCFKEKSTTSTFFIQYNLIRIKAGIKKLYFKISFGRADTILYPTCLQ